MSTIFVHAATISLVGISVEEVKRGSVYGKETMHMPNNDYIIYGQPKIVRNIRSETAPSLPPAVKLDRHVLFTIIWNKGAWLPLSSFSLC